MHIKLHCERKKWKNNPWKYYLLISWDGYTESMNGTNRCEGNFKREVTHLLMNYFEHLCTLFRTSVCINSPMLNWIFSPSFCFCLCTVLIEWARASLLIHNWALFSIEGLKSVKTFQVWQWEWFTTDPHMIGLAWQLGFTTSFGNYSSVSQSDTSDLTDTYAYAFYYLIE